MFDLTCTTNMAKDALDLLNRLQAEKESLKTELDFAKAFRKETEAEFSLMHRKYGNMLKTAKAEAYKEFAERLKEKYKKVGLNSVYSLHQFLGVVDNLLKELVGDTDA